MISVELSHKESRRTFYAHWEKGLWIHKTETLDDNGSWTHTTQNLSDEELMTEIREFGDQGCDRVTAFIEDNVLVMLNQGSTVKVVGFDACSGLREESEVSPETADAILKLSLFDLVDEDLYELAESAIGHWHLQCRPIP